MASHQQPRQRGRKIAVYVQALLYTLAGINHFLQPAMYAAIVPPLFPAFLSVYVSGIAEVIGGLLLLIPSTRRIAGIALMMLLVAVFPANIFMTVQYFQTNHPHAWISVLRLPIQPLLIWLAWWSTKK